MNTPPPGFWPSVIDEAGLFRLSSRIIGIFSDGNKLYKLVNLPELAGANKLFVLENSEWRPVFPDFLNAASKVHEYGGGAVRVSPFGLAAVNREDGQIYLRDGHGEFRRLTNEKNSNFADPDISSKGYLAAVEEVARPAGKPENRIAFFRLKDGKRCGGLKGNDFYSSPRFSPKGDRLLWLEWSLNEMPWDKTELYAGDFTEEGELKRVWSPGTEGCAVFQPEWAGEDVVFVDERTGWGNLYRFRNGECRALLPRDKEFSKPHWVFGQSTYRVLPGGKILYSHADEGFWKLGVLSEETGAAREFGERFAEIYSTAFCGGEAYALVGKVDAFPEILRLNLETLQTEPIEKQAPPGFEPSRPEAVRIPVEGAPAVHGFYYPPKNPGFRAEKNETIPYLLKIHGGPTSCASASLSLATQYWTGRGFGFLDLNYRGSTGFGKKYRQALYGRWGLSDVEDYVAAARWLGEAGEKPKPSKIFIRGGSSGGYTALRALIESKLFSGAACLYGISDLKALVADTHKFESSYDAILLSADGRRPEAGVYEALSPIHRAGEISSPVIFFQGGLDKVVPPNQTQMIYDQIRDRLPLSDYVLYPDEAHGFRKIESQSDSLKKELAFYQKILSS